MADRSQATRHNRRNNASQVSSSSTASGHVAVEEGVASSGPPDFTETLKKMTEGLQSVKDAVHGVREPAKDVVAYANRSGDTAKMIAIFHEEMMKTRETHEKQLERLRGRAVGSELKSDIAELVLADIRPQVKSDVAASVQTEVAQQFRERLPLTYNEQLGRNKAELRKVQDAISNSEARLLNSQFERDDEDEVLNKVTNDNGQLSKVWPATLRYLWSYDIPKTHQLLKDYGLQSSNELELNLNKFMMHIGIKFKLVTVDTE